MSQLPMNPTLPKPLLWSKAKKNKTQPLGSVMVDISGLHLNKKEIERLQHPSVGGVILFSRNYKDPIQLTQLCQHIHSLRDDPLLIAIDHEGGRVQRCRSAGFTPLPAMRHLGQYWEQEPLKAMQMATEIGFVLAAELRACGVDFSFTPVLDLDYGNSQVIGDRAFHHDPRVVSLLSRALIQGMQLVGMAACGKHFPGHGYASADSHTDIPEDDREFEDIWKNDILPYFALGDMVLPAIMPAHVLYLKYDFHPAGFSRKWIQDVLRKRLNYQGMVFSDDLTMEGASVAGNITQRAQAAFYAGCDMVLVCNHPELADQLLDELEPIHNPQSLTRLRALMPQEPFISWKTLQTYPHYLQARAMIAEFGLIFDNVITSFT